jgi:hypothetical protein
MKLVPIKDYEWTDDYSFHRTLTCVNHTDARYLTKNPFWRSIHVVKFPEGDIPRSETGECQCPMSDLAVVVKDLYVEVGPQKATTDSSTVAAQAMAYELEGWRQHTPCLKADAYGCDSDHLCEVCAQNDKVEDLIDQLHVVAAMGHGFGYEIRLPFTLLLPHDAQHSVIYQITQEN